MDNVPETARILNKELPAETICRIARETGAVRRVFKVDIVTLVWTVILAPKNAGAVTLSAMKSLFETLSNKTLAPSAFQYRFNERFAKLMRGLVDELLARTSELKRVAPIFEKYCDVRAIDSSIIKLADCLSHVFPGPRNNSAPAAMKVNAVYSIVRATLNKVVVAKGTKSEVKFLDIDGDLEGGLLLFDLGYFSFKMFRKLDKVGAHFISRLKSNVNPRIVEDHAPAGPGRRRQLKGMKLKDAIKNLSRNELDVTVELKLDKTKKNSKTKKTKGQKTRRPTPKLTLRVVGVRHPETDQFHLYITNVPRSAMTPEQVRVAYTARWFVELVFKELKSDCGMDKLPSKKQPVVEALVYASIIRLLLSRKVVEGLVARIKLAAEQSHGPRFKEAVDKSLQKRITTRRAVRALSLFGPLLLPKVVELATGRKMSARTLDLFFLASMVDPNIDRPSLASRIENLESPPEACICSSKAA